jgi:hypothetical protein
MTLTEAVGHTAKIAHRGVAIDVDSRGAESWPFLFIAVFGVRFDSVRSRLAASGDERWRR